MAVPSERWYVSGPLSIGTSLDEPTDAQTQKGVTWSNVGTAIRHPLGDSLNLLDGRAGVPNQGPGLGFWGLNGAGKSVRLGLMTSRFTTTADGASSGYLAFHTKPVDGDVTEALRITATGNVGVGTPTPDSKLDVRGAVRTTGLSITDAAGAAYPDNWIGMANNIDGATKWLHIGGITDGGARRIALYADRVFMAGNVGIGTTQPAYRLHVQAPTAVALFQSTTNSGFLQIITSEGMDNRVEVANRPGGRLSLYTPGGGDVLNVTRSGNVGIRTITPRAALEVVGGAIVDNLSIPVDGTISIPFGVTPFKRILHGREFVGSGPGGVKSVTVTFPHQFKGAPSVVACVRGDEIPTHTDTFAVSTKAVTAGRFSANIWRTDGGMGGGGWGQHVYLDWIAWE